MTSTIFHSSKFEFKGVPIPEFDMESGKLIRLCLPNFDSKGNSLVHDFRYGLLSHFEKEIPKVKWSKEYDENLFRRYLNPLTVENYIIKKLNTDRFKAKDIAEYLELNFKEKVDGLILGKRKALAIKCDFEKYETLIFDYYGVGAREIEYLERIINNEIVKGKSGIALDRIEYNQNDEINRNIERIKITVGNTMYKT